MAHHLFSVIAPKIQMLMSMRHRDHFPNLEVQAYDLSTFNTQGSLDDFIISIPMEERIYVAAALIEDSRFWFTSFLIIGFSIEALARYQRLTLSAAAILSEREMLAIRQL